MNRKKQSIFLAAAAFAFLLSTLLSMVYLRMAEETLSSHIAPQVLRFHVLANSDSHGDQMLKLDVKQMLIDTIQKGLEEELPNSRKSSNSYSKEMMRNYITIHGDELEKKAESYMAARGFNYPASIRLEKCYFPTKTYGDVIFPCGTYDSIRVLLGHGTGKNWWCVLYPPLCFTDNAIAEVPTASKEKLKYLLSDDDYDALMKKRRVVFGELKTSPKDNTAITVQIRLKFLK
ncbi:MAG: stage II sporulation protein R [Clostridium sp.]